MLAFTGCKKDEQQSSVKKTDSQIDAKIAKQLLAFHEQLNLKSGGSLQTDSAIWYLEGLLNFENANNDHHIINLTFNYDSIVVYTGGSTISIETLNSVYLYFTNRLNQISGAFIDSSYRFDLIDLSTSKNGLKNGETVIKMIAPAGLNLIGDYFAFENEDYWIWGWDLGKCGSYSGNNIGTDAADKLQQRFNSPINLLVDGYFTSVGDVEAWPWESVYSDLNYPGSWYPSMIFYAAGSGPNPPLEPCLSPADLNYYLSKFDFIKNNCKPAGKTFKNVEVIDTYGLGVQYWERVHYYKLFYGIFHLNPPHS